MFWCLIVAVAVACFSDRKRRAWVLTLVNSFISTAMGCVYMFYAHPGKPSLLTTSSPDAFFYTNDVFCGISCLWFGIANVCDLLLGRLFYSEWLALGSSYIHHVVYIWLMVFVTTGNGGFVSTPHAGSAFVFMMVEELPTFLLAVGTVFPSRRTDLGFGITFFIFRILYHLFVTVNSIRFAVNPTIVFMYLLTLLLHVVWFIQWASKYGRSSSRGISRAPKEHVA